MTPRAVPRVERSYQHDTKHRSHPQKGRMQHKDCAFLPLQLGLGWGRAQGSIQQQHLCWSHAKRQQLRQVRRAQAQISILPHSLTPLQLPMLISTLAAWPSSTPVWPSSTPVLPSVRHACSTCWQHALRDGSSATPGLPTTCSQPCSSLCWEQHPLL